MNDQPSADSSRSAELLLGANGTGGKEVYEYTPDPGSVVLHAGSSNDGFDRGKEFSSRLTDFLAHIDRCRLAYWISAAFPHIQEKNKCPRSFCAAFAVICFLRRVTVSQTTANFIKMQLAASVAEPYIHFLGTIFSGPGNGNSSF